MKAMKEMIQKFVKDFNSYSELVALNYEKKMEGTCDEAILQWNRGNLHCIEEYLKTMAESMGIELVWEYGEHTFSCGDRERKLNYRTVHLLQ